MAKIDDLEFRITATTDALRTDLARGSAQIQQFTRSADRQFTSLGTRFNQVGRGMRDALALFGVAFGARAFARWAADAMKSAEATDAQRKAFDGMRLALGQLNDVIQQRSLPLLAKFAELTTDAAEGWRMFLAPSDVEQKQKELRAIYDDIALTESAIGKLDSAGIIGKVLFGTEGAEKLKKDLEELKERARATLAEIVNLKTNQSDKGLQEFDLVAIHKKMAPQRPPFEQLEQDARVAAWEDRMKAGQKLTEQMATDVEKQVAAWRDAKGLLAEGIITPETLRRLDESQLQFFDLNEIRAKFQAPLKELETQSAKTARIIGENFQDAFAGWLVGADLGFKDLLKRMAAEMATSAIFKGLSGLFPGGSFFSNFFGGFRAQGGPLETGKWYIAGEKGPEPVWGGGAGAFAMAGGRGGGSVVIHQYNTFSGGSDSREQRAAMSAELARNNQRLKAEISHEIRRGRI